MIYAVRQLTFFFHWVRCDIYQESDMKLENLQRRGRSKATDDILDTIFLETGSRAP